MDKTCPISGKKCIGENCAWWLNFADDCSTPIIASILADSSICRNVYEKPHNEELWEDDNG